jgi:hypothetical protein
MVNNILQWIYKGRYRMRVVPSECEVKLAKIGK